MPEIYDLAVHEESAGDPGAISAIDWDPGGVSYGLIQLSSNSGSAAEFVDWLQRSESMFGVILSRSGRPGSREFSAGWLYCVDQDREDFARQQLQYAKEAYFDTAAANAAEIGFDVTAHSIAVQAVIFSSAVQHGPGAIPELLQTAGVDQPEAQLIMAIYNVRTQWAGGLADRYSRECEAALKMLGEEQTA